MSSAVAQGWSRASFGWLTHLADTFISLKFVLTSNSGVPLPLVPQWFQSQKNHAFIIQAA